MEVIFEVKGLHSSEDETYQFGPDLELCLGKFHDLVKVEFPFYRKKWPDNYFK